MSFDKRIIVSYLIEEVAKDKDTGEEGLNAVNIVVEQALERVLDAINGLAQLRDLRYKILMGVSPK